MKHFFFVMVYVIIILKGKLFAQRTQSIAAFSELQTIQHQNLHYEPMLIYFAGGLHHNLDIITSGKSYALGINQSIAFANSMQIKQMYFYEYFSYLYARMGFMDKNDESSILCIRTGLGVNIYRDYNKLEIYKAIVVSNYFIESIFDFGRPIYFRYHRTFFHHKRTKYGFQMGILFPL